MTKRKRSERKNKTNERTKKEGGIHPSSLSARHK
jgi:hypothetical protein